MQHDVGITATRTVLLDGPLVGAARAVNTGLTRDLERPITWFQMFNQIMFCCFFKKR